MDIYTLSVENLTHAYSNRTTPPIIKIWGADKLQISGGELTQYQNADKIKSCIMPQTVSSVEPSCFYQMKKLLTARGQGISAIGKHAFYRSSIVSCDFPNLRVIDDYAFNYAYGLAEIQLSNVISVGSDAFTSNNGLRELIMPEVISVSRSAFSNASISTVYLPKLKILYGFDGCRNVVSAYLPEVEILSAYAFRGWKSITELDLPKVEKAYAYAFSECSSLTSINAPNLNTITDYGIQYCTSLRQVSFPSLSSAGSYLFSNCPNLSSFDIPKLRALSWGMCISCFSLSSIELPGDLTSIASRVFEGCSSLTSISLTNTSRVVSLASVNSFAGLPINYKIHVPSNLYSSYVNAANWKTISSHIEALIVEEKDISKLDIEFPTTVIADGSVSYTPVPTIIDSYGNPLVYGTDFTCTYSNNTGIGTATCVIAGIGTFTGTVTKTFEIINFTGTIINIDTSLDDKFGIYAATRMNNAPETIIDWGD